MTDGPTLANNAPGLSRSPQQRSAFPSWVHAIWTEPLVHFVMLGTLVFALSRLWTGEASPSPQRVTVTAGKIEHLASLFARTWQRPPTTDELKGLIDDYVREEVAYREGKRLGLDQDDTIVRRRIRQKLDFIADDLASQIEPTEAQLSDFLKVHSESYRLDSRLAFRQVFLDPERHPEDVDKIAAELLDRLQTDVDAPVAELGDATLLEHRFQDVAPRAIASLFGERFADSIQAIPVKQWRGPISSAYGLHLVFVEVRTEGQSPQLNDVRESVRRDWEQEQRQALVESFYEGLLERYEIEIDWPDATAEVP